MRLLAAALVLPAVMLAVGCGSEPSDDAAADVVARFVSDIAAGDFRQACTLLAKTTRDSLQYSEMQPCPSALRSEQLAPGGEVRSVEAFGRAAMVTTASDTVFVGEFAEGWRITAAGCTESEHRKFDCLLGVS